MRNSNFCTCFTSAWNVKASTTSHPFPLCSTHRANGVCVHSTCHFQLTDTWNSHFVLTQKNFLIKRFAELACASLYLLIMIYHFMKCGNNKLRNIQEPPLPRRQRGDWLGNGLFSKFHLNHLCHTVQFIQKFVHIDRSGSKLSLQIDQNDIILRSCCKNTWSSNVQRIPK